MPPRLYLRSIQYPLVVIRTFPPTFLLPFLQQTRSASIISSLSDVPAAYNKRIRRGRGPSSGKGKTSGRGQKGLKARGKVPLGFQGGQTVEEAVKGVRGEKNNFATDLSPINLDTIQSWIEQKRLDPSAPITIRELVKSRAIHGVGVDGIKLLGRGANTLKTPINIIATRASETAIAAVEAAGGTVTTRYYTESSIRRIRQGQTHPYVSLAWKGPDHLADSDASKKFKYRLPDPVGRKDLEYYRDPAHRGYLSYMIGEGESPSLFFKTPLQGKLRARAVQNSKRGQVASNRIW